MERLKFAAVLLIAAIAQSAAAMRSQGLASTELSAQDASLSDEFIGTANTGFMELSNDHTGKDNEGFDELTKMLITFIVSAVTCLVIVLLTQSLLTLVTVMQSKEYRYELVKLQKNYRNLQRANQLPKSSY